MRTGIDIGFTDESLKRSKYALCKGYRSRYVGLYADVPKEGSDEFASYRAKYKVINMARLEDEEPSLFQKLSKGEPPIFRQDFLHWHESIAAKYDLTDADARRLKNYVELQSSPRVLFGKMPHDMADELKRRESEHLINAWWDLPYEKHKEICKPCPIRPMDEDNCYIRFSNYPGMNGFRHGFALTLLYSAGIDEEKMKGAYFSFPQLNREAHELPKHKIAELFEMCRDTPINKGPEVIFNSVVVKM